MGANYCSESHAFGDPTASSRALYSTNGIIHSAPVSEPDIFAGCHAVANAIDGLRLEYNVRGLPTDSVYKRYRFLLGYASGLPKADRQHIRRMLKAAIRQDTKPLQRVSNAMQSVKRDAQLFASRP